MAVCIGTMVVGSIKTTVQEGQSVKRGQEFGYFAFGMFPQGGLRLSAYLDVSGGSTIVLLFEKDVLEWDEDLSVDGLALLETLVRVGIGIGRGRRLPLNARTSPPSDATTIL
jgi:phosphatidylserine decarboxylase